MPDKMLLFVFFLAIVGMTNGVLVGPVRLGSMERYIDYRLGPSETNSLIECPIKLEDSETLEEVTWSLYEDDSVVGRYFWSEGAGRAEGRLEGLVRLDREDWDLELTELTYELSGFYSCSATTDSGTSAEAAMWEVLIIDVTSSAPQEGISESSPCQFISYFKMSAVYPEPTLHSGLYSDSLGGYFEEVRAVDWHKQAFPNLSYAFSHENVVFEITDKTPYDVYFLSSVGVLKKDGSYISLQSVKLILQEFETRGCPPVKTGAYQQITYNTGGKTTCRGEIAPPGAGQLKATVSCIDGYKPSGTTTRTSMELGCSTKSWEWGIPNDYPGLSNIKCVVNGSDFTATGSSVIVMTCLLLLHLLRQ